MQNPYKLWSKILIDKYKRTNREHDPKKIVSRTWKNIQNGWQDVKKAMEWRVHKKDKINFIRDKWIHHCGTIGQSIHGPFPESENHLKVREVYQNGEWNFDSLSFIIPEEMKVVIMSHMLSSDESKEDTLIWGLTNNGLFSTSTAYRHIKEANENHKHETSERFKWIWSAKAPNKIKTFLWNHNTFNNKNKGVSPSLVIHQAIEYPKIIEKEGNDKNNKITIEVNWKPPDNNTFKLNVDGFVKSNPGPGGFLMTKLEITKAEHVFREQNRVADKLSKEGVKNVLFDEPNILTTATTCTQKEVDADMLGTKFTRVRNEPFCIIQGQDVAQTINNDPPMATSGAPTNFATI
ncbi:hypothetical protein KY284_033017 [Solanum tuberosum]|nr:hypothetical protein KY284_033017 [Solanum tuberosum]